MSLFGIAKSSGFDPYGMHFDALQLQLRRQARRSGVGKDVELRWAPARGFYAKSKTWNRGADPFQRKYGASKLERGEKYLAVREEIARSISVSYGYQIIDGKWVGDYVVDLVIDKRARAEAEALLGLEIAAGNPYADPDARAQRIEQLTTIRKRDICLRLSDFIGIKKALRKIDKSKGKTTRN